MNKLEGAHAYMNAIQSILDQVRGDEINTIDQAASAIVETIRADGMVYIFGTGHSHMLAEEGHFRAGGLSSVCPILATNLMIHESATLSSQYERMTGMAPIILARYKPEDRDVLIIFSNSGVNAVPVEMALTAKEQGLTVIGVTSLQYSRQAPLSPIGKRLCDVVDIHIDNHIPPGDAIVEISDTGLSSGPASTIVSAFILDALLTEVVWRLAAGGVIPPVYISSNMPAAGDHNQALLEQYKPRNPHL